MNGSNVFPSLLACPLDGSTLTQQGSVLKCAEGHHFDIAAKGYANLLPVQYKRSKDPGDSKAMIAARGRFLDTGYYRPIAEAVAKLLAAEALPQSPCLFDAGCGEGYYLDYLHRSLRAEWNSEPLSIGLDISKWAVMAATRRNRAITWLVGSNKRPPLLPGSVDAILCLFGYPDYAAFQPILKPGGKIVLVDPGPDHLIELRQVIYDDVRRSPPPSLTKAEALGFTLRRERSLRYGVSLKGRAAVADLLTMTPHLYRAGRTGKEAAAKLEDMDLTVDVSLRTLSALH